MKWLDKIRLAVGARIIPDELDEPMALTVDRDGGHVVVILNRPMKWFMMQPEVARAIAMSLLDVARRIQPPEPKPPTIVKPDPMEAVMEKLAIDIGQPVRSAAHD